MRFIAATSILFRKKGSRHRVISAVAISDDPKLGEVLLLPDRKQATAFAWVVEDIIVKLAIVWIGLTPAPREVRGHSNSEEVTSPLTWWSIWFSIIGVRHRALLDVRMDTLS